MTAAIVLILMMTSVTLMADVAVKPANAQLSAMLGETREPPAGVTPYLTQETTPYISIRQNVLGLGQQNVFNVWVSPSLETDRRYMNNITKAFLLTLTKPDGTKAEIYLGNANSEGTQWAPYTMDQTGIWKAKFTFFGTFFPQMTVEVGGMFGVPSGTVLRTLWMKPSSTAEYQFTVQADMLSSWPPSPLPSGYWEWPVDFHNREWWLVTGGYPTTGYSAADYTSYFDSLYPGTNPIDIPNSMFYPFVAGPSSAHVLWKKTEELGGMYGGVGGTSGQFADAGYSSALVYHGRVYRTATRLMQVLVNGTYRQQPTQVAECTDLRTGEIYYQIPTSDGGITPIMIGYDQGTQTQSDVATFTPELMTLTNGRLYKINPNTGAVTTNVSLPSDLYPTSTGGGLFLAGFGSSGTPFMNQLDEYFLVVQNLGNSVPEAQRYRLINWTGVGSSTNFATRIISNTTYARSSLPTYIDWSTGLGATISANAIDGFWIGQNLTGFNARTGQTLWTKNFSEPMYSFSCTLADHGKIATLSMYGRYVAYNLADGSIEWETETMNFPFGASAFGVYGVASAYGLLFRPGYDGLWAFNWTNGETAWFTPRYAKAPFESTFTEYANGTETYPGQTNVRIADGKVYIYDGEHSPQQPRTRGWSLYCFDVYTGDKLWELAIGGATMFGSNPSIGPIADGYLIMPATNGVTYTIGIGKSTTTATASPKTIAQGAQVLIEGTVLDQSPAQPGTPCVSKDSMTTQMNYLHLQYPIAGIWGNETISGVPVALSATGSDGTFYDLGTVTTNGYYGTFSQSWTPPKQDTYMIMANFAGDESYGSSGAATAITVGPAPPEPNDGGGANVNTSPDYTNLLYGILVAVIIAIVLAIAALIRKK